MPSCIGGQCHPTVEKPSVRCMMHASIAAKEAMEKQGWVCINEYGHEAAQAVDAGFLDAISAVQQAGVTLQRWMAGWDANKQMPIYGIWAPRPVAAILVVCEGKVKRQEMVQILKEAKINTPFVQALDAAWRLGGREAAAEIIMTELPHIAAEINRSVQR